MGDVMPIYEVKCPICDTIQLVDSRKQMFRRLEPLDDSGIYINCQTDRCNKLFRVATHELKEVKQNTNGR